MLQRRSQRFSTKQWRWKERNVFILSMYVTTRRGQYRASVHAPVCQVITAFVAPQLQATLSGRLHCPLLAAQRKCRALQITDHQFESLSFYLCSFPFFLSTLHTIHPSGSYTPPRATSSWFTPTNISFAFIFDEVWLTGRLGSSKTRPICHLCGRWPSYERAREWGPVKSCDWGVEKGRGGVP